MSDFALTDINNPSAGFAKSGLNVEISAASLISKTMGFVLMYRNQNNPLDQGSLISQTTTKYPNITWGASVTNWKTNAFMAGYYSSYPLSAARKVFLDLKFLIGGVKIASPSITLTGTQNNFSVTETQASSSAFAFAFCVGAGLKFDISHMLFLLLHVDYLQATPSYTDVPITGTTGQASSATFTQKVSTLNLNIGLGVKLD